MAYLEKAVVAGYYPRRPASWYIRNSAGLFLGTVEPWNDLPGRGYWIRLQREQAARWAWTLRDAREQIKEVE